MMYCLLLQQLCSSATLHRSSTWLWLGRRLWYPASFWCVASLLIDKLMRPIGRISLFSIYSRRCVPLSGWRAFDLIVSAVPASVARHLFDCLASLQPGAAVCIYQLGVSDLLLVAGVRRTPAMRPGQSRSLLRRVTHRSKCTRSFFKF